MSSTSPGHFARFNANEPASLPAIRHAEIRLTVRLPADYRTFLIHMNGGEGFIGTGYAILWRIEEVEAKNSAYHVPEFAPQLLLFGSDGGGEAFAFDKNAHLSIVSAPFLGWEPALPIAATFDSFLAWLAKR